MDPGGSESSASTTARWSPIDELMIPTILSQHAEEAAFLWLLRDAAVGEPHYSLRDLSDLDDRVEAHLHGLRVAGDAGWDFIKSELAWKEPGEVFTGAVLAFASGDPLRVEEVLAVADEAVELGRGAASALGWLPPEAALRQVRGLLESEQPVRRRIGVAGAAAHRHDLGSALGGLCAGQDNSVRARALKAAGELGRYDLAHALRGAFDDEDPECRFRGAWSAALIGDTGASNVLYVIAREGGPYAEQAAVMAARRLAPPQALAWQRQLVADGQDLRVAAVIAGAVGDPEVVPWLIEIMTVDELARAAGEAFSFITGLDLAYEDLERDWPEGFEAGPTESAADEDVAMDRDENLPWPDPDLIRAWWQRNGGRFAQGTRYLRGQPISLQTLQEALRLGMQRVRIAAALELALSDPSAPLFNVRAPGRRQRQLLGP